MVLLARTLCWVGGEFPSPLFHHDDNFNFGSSISIAASGTYLQFVADTADTDIFYPRFQ